MRVLYSKDYRQWKMRHWRHLSGSLKAVANSNKGDTIVAWHYLQAVLAWWICRLTFKRRRFVCLNVLLKIDRSKKNILHRYLCRKAFKADNFKATVTSSSYGEWLNSQLGMDVRFYLLRDVYHDYYSTPAFKESKNGNIVFCGGASGRDWEQMLRIVKGLPDVRFYMVMPGREYRPFMERHKDDIPDNVKIVHDIPYNHFMYRLCQSSLVVLPLAINAPAGLTVMFQAASNRRMVITSDTSAMRDYFMPYQLCGVDPEKWIEKITYYLEHKEERVAEAQRFHDFVTTHCTERQYAETVKRIIEDF